MLEKHSEMKNRQKAKKSKSSAEKKNDRFLVFKTLACLETLHFKPISSKKIAWTKYGLQYKKNMKSQFIDHQKIEEQT